jgi:hypothetical protein
VRSDWGHRAGRWLLGLLVLSAAIVVHLRVALLNLFELGTAPWQTT